MPRKSTRCVTAATALAFLPVASFLHAQAAPPASGALEKYDTNHNGRLDPDERAAMERDQAAAAADAASSKPRDGTIAMSPFEVQADSRGYYAENTMSGTRLNTKLEDLASSISVVTKEQMSDFAALDINDVFLYEAGTEGLGTYTDFSFDRNGYPTDNSSLSPQSSNRIRGLTSANTAFGNFQTSGRVPIDPIITDAVEISRGPNANIFGLGNAGGTVNIVPASANLTREITQAQFRADSYGGYRSSLALNRVLRPDVLAVRASGVFEHTGYTRKPSGTDTTRFDGFIKYKPFKYTTLSAFVEDYRIHGTMPNLTMPRDEVTPWIAAGRPLWNNLTDQVVLNGVPGATTYSMSTLPSYFINTIGTGRTNSVAAVEANGAISFWGAPQATTAANSPAVLNKNVFLVNTNSGLYTNQPMFTADPSLSDDTLYDWHHINLASMNYLNESTKTTNFNLEQFFLNSQRQVLALQVGFFRESSDKYRRDLAGAPTSQKFVGGLYVDPNLYLPDGAANPNVGRPFIGLWNPRSYIAPLDHDNYRGQLAYKLDLRREPSIWRWLGMQQVSAYMEYKDYQDRSITYDDVITDAHAWIPAGTVRGPSPTALTNNYFRFYVGDTGGRLVDYGPHSFAWGTYPYSYGPALNGAAITTENATLGPGVLNGGGTANNREVLKTEGVILQSYLLKDRVVTTVGIRRDRNYNRAGAKLAILPDDYNADMHTFNQWATGDWSYDAGTTKTAGIVVKALSWLNLNANVSDSFQPSTPARNLFLQTVPDPTGSGHDFGFTANLFSGKVTVRYDHYKTTQINARDGQSTTLGGRAIQMDLDSANRASTPFNLATQATNWVKTQNPSYTPDQVVAAVAKIMQIDPRYIEEDFGNTGRLAETDDVIAKGDELEIFYNASNYWTVKANVTRQQSINGQMADDINNYIASRMPVWTSIVDPLTGLKWYTAPYDSAGRTAADFITNFVEAPLKVAQAMRGKSRPEIREWHANVLSSYRLAGLTDRPFWKNLQIGGALRWESKGAIGYYGVQQLPAVITDLDPNRPIYDKAHLYVDAFITYRTRLFRNKVGTTFQFNVRNLQESGRLQPIQAYPDGSAIGYRIVDPRQFIFTVTFDL